MIVVDPRFTRTASNADLFLQIRHGQHRVLQLYLRAGALEFFFQVGIGYSHTASDHRDKFADQQLRAEAILKFANAHTGHVLDDVLVLLVANEIAARKEVLAVLSLQGVAQLFISDLQADASRFCPQRFLRDQLIGSALHKVRHDLLRNVSTELLPGHVAQIVVTHLLDPLMSCYQPAA